MAFTREELDRMIGDAGYRGVITGHTYCANCGYNLRTLPFVYRCPECGNNYNAQPLMMRGIFKPSQCLIPFGKIATSLIFAIGTFAVGSMAARGRNYNPFFVIFLELAVVFGLFAAHFAWQSCRALSQGGRGRKIARRIAKEEDELAAHPTD